ncbi:MULTISPECIES: hypothetical protein [Rhodopirellula]|uniref:hypothetical protein n=1 Tax=Rhodopirellula TaxID=265488 RepID=UPI00257A52BC|nr:hypothetical protein [Rhodopirellula sp. UBA1907]
MNTEFVSVYGEFAARDVATGHTTGLGTRHSGSKRASQDGLPLAAGDQQGELIPLAVGYQEASQSPPA